MRLQRSMTVLQVADMERAVAFYRRGGFRGNGWPDDSGDIVFTILQRGDVTLALQLSRADEMPVNSHWAAYLYVSDIDAIHAEFVAADLSPTQIRRNTHYGCHDFDLRDPDGHLLAFGQDLEPTPGPGLAQERHAT